MTRLAIAIVVIMIACLFLWVSSSYPTPEERQKGEELKIQTTEPNPIPSDRRTIK